MGSYSKAEPFLLDALAIRENLFGQKHSLYATSLNNLALLYQSVGIYDKSELFLKKALHIKELVFGKQHPDYASALNNLASFYVASGIPARAEPLYLQALQLRTQLLGNYHPDYFSSTHNLASLYQVMDDYAKAESLFVQSHENLLNQVTHYFPALSDREKASFYQENVGNALELFNSFVLRRQIANPSITFHLYDNVLATKALLFQSQNKIRNAIFSSGDTALISLYEKWQGQRNFFPRCFK